MATRLTNDTWRTEREEAGPRGEVGVDDRRETEKRNG